MIHSTLRLGLVGLLISGAAGLALAQPDTGTTAIASTATIACGVNAVIERGMMKVEGLLQSPTALTGEYKFIFKSTGSGGTTNIRQGGTFTATPDTPVPIGSVMVNAGSNVDVTLTVTAGGKSYDCSHPLTARS